MDARSRAAAALLAGALGALAAADPAPTSPFVDRMDEPARPSALAARSLLVGVARAGDRLVAVGARGHVVLSDDGGVSWRQAAVPVASDLTAVTFPTAERGWAVGHDGVVLATRDGGATWTRQLDGRAIGPLLGARHPDGGGAPAWLRRQVALLRARPGEPFLDVWFEDERRGLAVGAFNLAMRTEDGGATWTPWLDRTANPEGKHLYAVGRAAGRVWVAGEQGLLLRLDPAGERLERVPVPYAGTFFGLGGAGNALVVYGLRGTALRTVDGGRTFERVETGLEDALVGSALLPDGRLVLLGQAGQLLVGSAAGGRFRIARALGERAAAAVVAAGPDAVVVAGAGGVRAESLRAPGGER
jgi:photosystem II stability/assembly factor-like uncharacterized protein